MSDFTRASVGPGSPAERNVAFGVNSNAPRLFPGNAAFSSVPAVVDALSSILPSSGQTST
jgi:hypothetical protein